MGTAERLPSLRSALRVAMLPAATGCLLAIALWRYGWPLDAYTWTILAALLLASILAAVLRARRAVSWPVLVLAVYIAFQEPFLLIPVFERWALCDDHGGRSGIELSPELRFGRDGTNTKLLESYLGPLPPHWWACAPQFPYIRDGNERVHSRNLIFQPYLPEVLELLPTHEARKQVLECLVDPENRLRVHQSLLLVALRELGYPPGHDAVTWWDAHSHLFRQERDATFAAILTRGWLQQFELVTSKGTRDLWIQRDAARNQERGWWGGHSDFGEEVSRLEWPRRGLGAKKTKLAGNVVWWPQSDAKVLP